MLHERTVALAALVVLLLVLVISLVPRWQATRVGVDDAQARAELENEYRKTLIEILTGLAVVFSLTFTWTQLRQTQDEVQENRKAATEQLRLAREQLDLTRRDYLARQLASALEQFADTSSSQVQLAGVFGLEQVATQSPAEQMPVLRILVAYVREARALPRRGPRRTVDCGDTLALPVAVQTSLDVLRRLSWRITDREQSFNRLDLSYADLRNANLDSANLEWTYFTGSRLDRVSFGNNARLNRAYFRNAHLEHAVLTYATRADFTGAAMCGAALDDARLDSANLQRANLQNAALWNADLTDANLDGADLSSAEGLDSAQLAKAQVSTTTKLPPNLAGKVIRRPSAFAHSDRPPPCSCPARREAK